MLGLVLAATACTGDGTVVGPSGSSDAVASSPAPGITPSPGASTAPREPPFRMEVRSVERVLLRDLRPGRIRRAMGRAVAGIRLSLTRLHRLGFLGEEALAGRFGGVVALFARRVRPAVREELHLLTLGPEASRSIDDVRDADAWLRVTVLLGRMGGPVSATARTFFRARGERADGDVVVLESRASWVLRPAGRGWTITGFSARRTDHPPAG